MKDKNIIRILGITLIVLFLSLYITQMSGYYEYTESKKTTLTEDAIKRFEADVSAGKKINAKDYLSEEKNYNNNLSHIGMKISNYIEKGFNKIMNSIFQEVNKAVNS